MDYEPTEDALEQTSEDRIRKACQQGFETAIPHLVDIAAGRIDSASVGTRVRAHGTLGRYGLEQPDPLVHQLNLVVQTLTEVTREHIADHATFADWCQHAKHRLDVLRAKANGHSTNKAKPLDTHALFAKSLAARILARKKLLPDPLEGAGGDQPSSQ